MADGTNSLYYVLINTSVGDNSGEFPSATRGEVEIKWKYSVYDDMGNSANYNNPSPRHKDPYAPDHDAAKTGVLRNEAEHKPWRETSPNNAPAGVGKQVELKSITITVKWNACGSNQKSPQVTKNANPGLGNGPNRGGR
jgi:hypothetical protein